MPLTFPPVSVVASGGIPVTNSKLGAPMTVVPTGKGLPITLTTKALGAPFYLKNPDGSDYQDASQILGNSMLAWWNADRSDLMTVSGGMVSSWRDVKNGYDAVQGVSASRPTYQATGFGGSPCVSFDGTDDYLEIATNSFPQGDMPSELWSVSQQNAPSSDAGTRAIVAYSGPGSGMRALQRSVSGGVNRVSAVIGNGTGLVTSAAPNVVFEGRAVARALIGSTQTISYQDNTSSAPTSVVPATAGGRTRIGAYSNVASPFSYWLGTMRDIIVTSLLTTEQASALTTYLLSRRNV